MKKKNGCDAKREIKKLKTNGLVCFIHVSGLKNKTHKYQWMVIDTIFGWLSPMVWYFSSATLPTE